MRRILFAMVRKVAKYVIGNPNTIPSFAAGYNDVGGGNVSMIYGGTSPSSSGTITSIEFTSRSSGSADIIICSGTFVVRSYTPVSWSGTGDRKVTITGLSIPFQSGDLIGMYCAQADLIGFDNAGTGTHYYAYGSRTPVGSSIPVSSLNRQLFIKGLG